MSFFDHCRYLLSWLGVKPFELRPFFSVLYEYQKPLSSCFQSCGLEVHHHSNLFSVVSSLFLVFGSWQEFFFLLGIWIFHQNLEGSLSYVLFVK